MHSGHHLWGAVISVFLTKNQAQLEGNQNTVYKHYRIKWHKEIFDTSVADYSKWLASIND